MRVGYIMITSDEHGKYFKEVESRKELLKPVKGTMLVHAIAVDEIGNLLNVLRRVHVKIVFAKKGFNGESGCSWDTVTMKIENRALTK